MYKIALTGSACSGKSTIAQKFKSLGIPVFHADVIIKFLLNNRLDVSNNIQSEFGNAIFTNGFIDENKISDDVFDKIINLIEFDVLIAFDEWSKRQGNAPYALYESSIVFERKINTAFDYTISVFAPKDERSNRFHRLNKDRFSLMTVNTLMSKEMEDLKKNSESQFIIHNYENMNIDAQIKAIHTSIVKNDKAVDMRDHIKKSAVL